MLKKIILFCFFSFSLVATSTEKFKDIKKDSWAYKPINTLLEKHIIRENSYEFNGEQAVTKYEFIYSLSKMLEQINVEKLNQRELKTFEILMNQFSDELNSISFDTTTYNKKLEEANDKIEVLKGKLEENNRMIEQLEKRIDELERRR